MCLLPNRLADKSDGRTIINAFINILKLHKLHADNLFLVLRPFFKVLLLLSRRTGTRNHARLDLGSALA